jgi:hypothetical protein
MSNKFAVLRTFVAAVTEIMGDQMPGHHYFYGYARFWKI